MKQFLFLLVLLFTTTVYPQQYVQKQDTQIINILTNAGYESGKTSWIQTTPANVTVVSGTAALFGAASVKFEATSGTEIFRSALITVPSGLKGKECHAVVNYATNDVNDTPYVATVMDASGTVLASKNLEAKIVMGVPTDLPTSVTVDGWECPTDKQIQLRVENSALGDWVVLDNMHLGSKTGGLGNAQDIVDALGYTPADQAGLASVSSTVNTLSGTVLLKANNLSDLANASTARTNLGLGTVAVENTVPTTKGGTGQTTYATGDLLVGSGTTLAKTPKGGNNQAFVTREDSVGWKEIDTSGGFNLAIDNPSFESSTTGYTTSGTVTLFRQDRQSDGVNYSPSDIKYLEIATNTNNGGACRTDTIPQNLENSSFELNFKYRTTSFAASSTMVVYQKNGTNVTSQTVSLDTNSVGLNQPFIDYKAYRGVTSGTLTTCWLKSSTSLNSLDVDIDNVYVGAQKSLVNGAIVGPTTPYVPTLVGFGTITNQGFSYARVGDSLYITGRFVAGTTTAVEARIPLPDNLVIASSIVSNRIRGQIYRSGFSDDYTVLINGGNSYLNIGITTAKLTPVNANTFAASGDVISFSAGPIPIQGQSGSGVSYDGRCPNDISCENNFAAFVGSIAAVTQENLDFISSCTKNSTGDYSCTFNTGVFSVTPNCSVSAFTGSDVTVSMNTQSTTTINYKTFNTAGSAADGAVTLRCSKQGTDFVAKKTIQGYLSQTVTTGSTSLERMERARIQITGASACTVISQSGSWLGSCTASSSDATIPINNGVFGSSPSCSGIGKGAANAFVRYGGSLPTTTSLSITHRDTSNALSTGEFDIICIGPRP